MARTPIWRVAIHDIHRRGAYHSDLAHRVETSDPREGIHDRTRGKRVVFDDLTRPGRFQMQDGSIRLNTTGGIDGLYVEIAAVAELGLEGTLVVPNDFQGKVQIQQFLAGDLTPAYDLRGGLFPPLRLRGTLEDGLFSGDLTRKIALHGTWDPPIVFQADIVVRQALVGDLTVFADHSAYMTLGHALHGVLEFFGTFEGSLSLTRPMTGTIDLTAVYTGDLTVLEPAPTFRAVITDGTSIAYSDDMSTFTTATAASARYANPTYSPDLGVWVCFDTDNDALMFSATGASWSTVQSLTANNGDGAVAWNETAGKFLALSSTVPQVAWESTDGTTWSSTTTSGMGAVFFNKMIWVADFGLYLLAGTDPAYSSDGHTWALTASSLTRNGIAYSPSLGRAVMVGGLSGVFMHSTNGASWTTGSTGATSNLADVAWSPTLGMFAAVGNNEIYTSTNGTTWTSRTPPVTANWTGVVWSEYLGAFFAVASSGTGSRSMTSTDGITWTELVSSTLAGMANNDIAVSA